MGEQDISIREARWDDLDRIVAMGGEFLRGSRYKDTVRERPDQMQKMAAQLLNDGSGVIFVAEHGKSLVGMIGMYAYPHPISGERMAAEMFWWVDPTFRGALGLRLLHRAIEWAKTLGEAEVVQLVAPTPTVARIYTRLGYTEVETLFQKRIK